MNPLVSIIIPVYNGSNYMREAIDSALAQTYKNIEILVVNDGSCDDGETERIALSYGDKIRYFKKENGGVSSALNLGIKEMQGEYFSWLSHDDAYYPEKIACEVSMLESSNEIVFCRSALINEKSEVIGCVNEKHLQNVFELNWQDALMYSIQYSMNGCAFLIPREVLLTAGLFDETLRYCQDVFMWWNIFLKKYSLKVCDYVGVMNRVHNKQLTQTGRALYRKDALSIADCIVNRFAEISGKEHNFLFAYAKGEAIHGNRNVVDLCIESASKRNLFTQEQRLMLRLLNVYAKIRPLLRKIYYRLKRAKV